MNYQPEPTYEQLANRVSALKTWPNRLIAGWWHRETAGGTETCVVEYLRRRAQAVTNRFIIDTAEIADVFGIPPYFLGRWMKANDSTLYSLVAPETRATWLKRKFEKLLEDAKSPAPELQATASLRDELYSADFA